MKNLKKALAMVVAVATLGTVTLIPMSTSAEITYVNDYGEEGTFYDTFAEYLDELGLELMPGDSLEAWEYNCDLCADWFTYHNPKHSITDDKDPTNVDYRPLLVLLEDVNSTIETTTVTETTTALHDPSQYTLDDYQSNVVTEAIIYLENAGDSTGTYYYKSPSVEPSIDISSLSVDDQIKINSNTPIKIDDYSLDISGVKNVITIDSETDEDNYIPVEYGDYYTHLYFEYRYMDNGTYWVFDKLIVNKSAEDTDTPLDDAIIRIENGEEVVYYDTYDKYIEATGDNSETSYLDWFVGHNTHNMGTERDVSAREVSAEPIEVTTAVVDDVPTEDTSVTTVVSAEDTTEVTTAPTESGSNSLYDSKWFAENAITEAIIYLDDADENSGTYYFKTSNNEPSIDISSLSEEDLDTLNRGFPVKIDDSIDVSAVEKVINVDKSHNEYIPIDCGSSYTNMYYNYNMGDWLMLTIYIPKLTTDTTTTATETTLGDSDSTEPSETTLQRGDVNGDGKINATDLLQLKKYILGLIDTLG